MNKGSIVERLCSDLGRKEPRYKWPTLLLLGWARSRTLGHAYTIITKPSSMGAGKTRDTLGDRCVDQTVQKGLMRNGGFVGPSRKKATRSHRTRLRRRTESHDRSTTMQ